MSKEDKRYQLWASKPKVTSATAEGTTTLGWELLLTTNSLEDLFMCKVEADKNYSVTKTTCEIELKVLVS